MNKVNPWLRSYVLPTVTDRKWAIKMGLSLIPFLLLLLLRPAGLNGVQALVTASIVLIVIWWSANLIQKIPSSLLLLGIFCACQAAPLTTIFSFPLSETFPLLALTYVFSAAISHSGLVEHFLQPLLARYVHTPIQCMGAFLLSFYLTFYVIPQPIARLFMMLTIYKQFFAGTTLSPVVKSVLYYALYMFHGASVLSVKEADMIFNYAAVSFSGVAVSSGDWIKAMFIPVTLLCLLLGVMLFLVFRKELAGVRIQVTSQAESKALTEQQRKAMWIILGTVILWMTTPLHHVSGTWVTLVSVFLLFRIGILTKKDWGTIDVSTLVFLAAAFSIGGVMKACGAADALFGLFRNVFPETFSPKYLCIMVLVTMLIHMILGSNTTTVSVVIPGLMILCQPAVPAQLIVFSTVIGLNYHAIVPFHSVVLMIGAAQGDFPANYVTRTAVPLTALVYLSALVLFYPYWKLIGLF